MYLRTLKASEGEERDLRKKDISIYYSIHFEALLCKASNNCITFNTGFPGLTEICQLRSH